MVLFMILVRFQDRLTPVFDVFWASRSSVSLHLFLVRSISTSVDFLLWFRIEKMRCCLSVIFLFLLSFYDFQKFCYIHPLPYYNAHFFLAPYYLTLSSSSLLVRTMNTWVLFISFSYFSKLVLKFRLQFFVMPSCEIRDSWFVPLQSRHCWCLKLN